jgi:hypothetical protein
MDFALFLWLDTLVRTMMGAFSELARIRKSANTVQMEKIKIKWSKHGIAATPCLPLSSASSTLQRASVNEMSGHVDCSPFSILCNVEGSIH